MIIRYKQKREKFKLFIGLAWTVLGFASFFLTENNNYFVYGYFLLGLSYIVIFLYNKKFQYLHIENNYVIKNSLPKKQFNLKELSGIKRRFGDITLLSKTQEEFHITGELIEKESLEEINQFLDSLKI